MLLRAGGAGISQEGFAGPGGAESLRQSSAEHWAHLVPGEFCLRCFVAAPR